MAKTYKSAKDIRTLKRDLLRKIYTNILNTHTIVISAKQLSDPNLFAEVDRHGKSKSGLMVLNPEKANGSLNEFLSTFIHECLHIYLKTSNEKIVKRLERMVYADMSATDKQALLTFFAQNSCWDD